jgi:hypothetical protein
MTTSKTKKILDNLPNFIPHGGNNYDFITSFDSSFQSVSDNIINLKSSIQISTATGKSLDDLALLFNLKRKPGESDTSFRNIVQTFFSKEFRGGTVEAIKKRLERILNLDVNDIIIDENENLILDIEIKVSEESEDITINQIATTINNAKPAGVYVKDINFTSSNDIFRVNLSDSNGEDTLL